VGGRDSFIKPKLRRVTVSESKERRRDLSDNTHGRKN
jgi:hypothetical protein